VSNRGRVRSFVRRRPRLMRLTLEGDGYRQVDLAMPAGRWTVRVHRLVMAAFVGPCPAGHEVDHINADRSDNRLENLRYVPHEENIDAATARGRMGGARPGSGRPRKEAA
jgi:hypothetical protein